MFWSTSLFALLAGACLVSGDPVVDGAIRLKRSVDYVQAAVLGEQLVLPSFHDHSARNKRQADLDSDQVDYSTLCVLGCANQLRAAAQPFQPTNQAGSMDNNQLLKQNMTVTRFTEMCSVMRSAVECFDRCPNSATKSQLKKLLDPIRFMCIDRFQDFKANFVCMQGTKDATTTQCTPRCKQHEAALKRLMLIAARPYLRQFLSVDEIQEMLSGSCQYVECQTDCAVGLTRTACGNTAAELTSAITQKTFSMVQTYYTMLGLGEVLPESCRRLARPGQNNSDRGQIEVNKGPSITNARRVAVRDSDEE